MNIRFDSKSVRVRVTLDEAKILEEQKTLCESFAFPDSEMAVEISLVSIQDSPIRFLFPERTLKLIVREKDFCELLLEHPSREARISVEILSKRSTPVAIVFEIDLFTRKKKSEAS